MKVVILCGGFGTRLSEKTKLLPKPMVEIGNNPILWHIMNIYGKYNFKEFILALGYKSEIIKDYFINYNLRHSDFKLKLKSGEITIKDSNIEDWNITLKETGLNTLTGGRLLSLKDELKSSSTFMLTYGDGVSDIIINDLIKFHRSHGKIATVTAVRPTARFGGLKIENKKVINFKEKPHSGEGWINGGFFVFEKEIFNYLKDDQTVLEQDPLENLALDGELMAYNHNGFWQCMDTIRDRDYLNNIFDKGEAPWLK